MIRDCGIPFNNKPFTLNQQSIGAPTFGNRNTLMSEHKGNMYSGLLIDLGQGMSHNRDVGGLRRQL